MRGSGGRKNLFPHCLRQAVRRKSLSAERLSLANLKSARPVLAASHSGPEHGATALRAARPGRHLSRAPGGHSGARLGRAGAAIGGEGRARAGSIGRRAVKGPERGINKRAASPIRPRLSAGGGVGQRRAPRGSRGRSIPPGRPRL